MSEIKSPGELFDEWAGDERAEKMGDHHWPVVSQAFDLITPSAGAYLELGVGSGYGLEHMATHQFAGGRCVGVDVSPRMVELAQKRTAHLDHVRALRAEFPRDDLSHLGPFAVIFSMEVLYYLADVQAGLAAAVDLLEPGGELWVLCDYYAENGSTHGWPEELGTGMTLWSMEDYRRGFAAAGLVDVEQRQLINPARRSKRPDDPGTLCTLGRKPG